MKRVGLILFGVVAAAVLTSALSFSVAGQGLTLRSNLAQAADKKVDPLAGSGGPVCVAVPIFSGGTKCPTGPGIEIPNTPGSGGAIVFYLKQIIHLANILVGGVIMLVLVVAGVMYIISAGDPGRTKKAKNMVVQAIVALVLYMFVFAILNFVVPGGVLTT